MSERVEVVDAEGEIRVAVARERVSVQVMHALTETTYGASVETITRDVRSLVVARSREDLISERAAALDLAISAAAYAASIDVQLPDEPMGRTRKRPGA